MFFRNHFTRSLLIGAGLLCFAATPATAECVIGSEPLFDPFAPYKGGSAIVHKDSGFVFPSEVSGFRRLCEMTTDFSGDNFQIRYERMIGEQLVAVDIAVVHLEDLTARDHYRIIKPSVMSHYASASVESEGDYFVSGREDLSAYQGIFDGQKDNVPWHVSLTAIDYGYWDARLIASYPHQLDIPAQEALMELVAAFQWQSPADQEKGEEE
ncbi:hypothetical protein [Sphingorhabdus sp. EL138]|jgi:hypothetical protein|uniref:hypothetical protein n=1 Tax=Sphingorhabdus sp. EL138 TaxID=2073156 RepID=UPI000D69F40E|nr:hypothetical protein [Sphingorhabdus sp. EL138]